MPAKKQSRASKKTSKTPLIILSIVIAAFVIIAAVMLLTPAPKEKTLLDTMERTENELFANDLLGSDFVSTNITVLGISVGMTYDDVIAKLGAADVVNEFEFGGVKNLEYAEKLGLNRTGITYHIEKGVVTRITVTNAMDPYLSGQSQVSQDKTDVYGIFGIPDRQYDLKKFRYFVYNDQGFESYINSNKQIQYAFVYPNRKLPSTATNTTKIDPSNPMKEPPPPVLLTDTTTLCDQGPAFGEDPATKECKAYDNSCLIPDYWFEVSDCSQNRTIIPR